ncbi:MAG: hypothetical protein Q8L76_16585, partial [Cypionkella sp.]|nr:hypothetical protein [Cypionkella sp.]
QAAIGLAVATAIGATPEQVLHLSTGVIGARLPVDKVTATVAHVESLPLSLTMPSKYSAQFPHRLEKIETIDKAIETSADGRPAPIRAGGIHDPAGWMDDTASARMPTALCPKARIATDPLPEGLRRPDTETHRFLFNCNVLYVEWDGNTIADAGVSWQKNSAQRGRNPSRPGPKTADNSMKVLLSHGRKYFTGVRRCAPPAT